MSLGVDIAMCVIKYLQDLNENILSVLIVTEFIVYMFRAMTL